MGISNVIWYLLISKLVYMSSSLLLLLLESMFLGQ